MDCAKAVDKKDPTGTLYRIDDEMFALDGSLKNAKKKPRRDASLEEQRVRDRRLQADLDALRLAEGEGGLPLNQLYGKAPTVGAGAPKPRKGPYERPKGRG